MGAGECHILLPGNAIYSGPLRIAQRTCMVMTEKSTSSLWEEPGCKKKGVVCLWQGLSSILKLPWDPTLKPHGLRRGGTVSGECPCHDGMYLALVSRELHVPLGAFQKRNIVPAWCWWLPQTCVYLDFVPWFLCLHCVWEDHRYLSILIVFYISNFVVLFGCVDSLSAQGVLL